MTAAEDEGQAQTFTEAIEEILSRLNEAEAEDFRSLLATLENLDEDLGDPNEVMGVEAQALREFLDIGVSMILKIIMSKPHGDVVLMPMTLATGMMIGYQLSENHAKESESQEGIIEIEEEDEDD